MCFAIPGKIIEVEGDYVVVNYGEDKREARTIIDVKIGDYVIISNKIVVKKIPEKEAVEAIKFFIQNSEKI